MQTIIELAFLRCSSGVIPGRVIPAQFASGPRDPARGNSAASPAPPPAGPAQVSGRESSPSHVQQSTTETSSGPRIQLPAQRKSRAESSAKPAHLEPVASPGSQIPQAGLPPLSTRLTNPERLILWAEISPSCSL
ncbi:hypothetical protein TIFTF001_015125 [Ficus carica]|uniref:Uncharacterized protein n=1 Tax=Ficus carica TaxID=3494 RepID=A0AA88AL18_FICCA|nr:hypothetical protein TIFTF001_015125 [Ficus carica]